MYPMPENYAIWPSVIPADTQTEMTIIPTERAFLFFEDREYQLKIIPVHADELNYHDPSRYEKLTAVAKNGVLRFTYTFCGEGEHTIILWHEDVKIQEFTVYSLKEDLYRLRPLRGDFHSHSYRSDGKRDPAALAGHYREQGYDFFALTDHNRFYPGGEIDETFAGIKLGLTRVRGEEVHTPGSPTHIVHVGGTSGVANLYLHDPKQYECDIAEYEKKVPENIPEQYKPRYARAMWATDRIHEVGGLAIFAHPYWRPSSSRVHNVCDELAMLYLKSGMFDAYEAIGGVGPITNNRSIALWGEVRSEGVHIPVVGSSDVHRIKKSAHFPNEFSICFAEDNTNDAIIAAVKAGNSVAVESNGEDINRHYRCYGSLRLMGYAQFLLQYYFPRRQRICQGEGVAMRAYAMGEESAALIEAQVAQSESFRQRFFGEKPPILPTAEILDFEDRWREIHIQEGPVTKGSAATSDIISRQI